MLSSSFTPPPPPPPWICSWLQWIQIQKLTLSTEFVTDNIVRRPRPACFILRVANTFWLTPVRPWAAAKATEHSHDHLRKKKRKSLTVKAWPRKFERWTNLYEQVVWKRNQILWLNIFMILWSCEFPCWSYCCCNQWLEHGGGMRKE